MIIIYMVEYRGPSYHLYGYIILISSTSLWIFILALLELLVTIQMATRSFFAKLKPPPPSNFP